MLFDLNDYNLVEIQLVFSLPRAYSYYSLRMDVVQESKDKGVFQAFQGGLLPSSSIPSPFQAVFVPFPGETLYMTNASKGIK